MSGSLFSLLVIQIKLHNCMFLKYIDTKTNLCYNTKDSLTSWSIQSRKGLVVMRVSTYEALSIMITFGTLVATIILVCIQIRIK